MRAILAGYILGGLLLGAIPSQRPLGANGRWLILVFVAYQLIPLAGVSGSAYSVARIFNWIMFAPLAFVLLDGQSRRVLLASALTVGTVLVLGVGLQLTGILGFTWGGLSLAGSGQFEQHATRYTSFILNPNNLGLVMLILAVVVHVVTRERTNTWRTSLLGSVLASVCLVVVFMTIRAVRSSGSRWWGCIGSPSPGAGALSNGYGCRPDCRGPRRTVLRALRRADHRQGHLIYGRHLPRER